MLFKGIFWAVVSVMGWAVGFPLVEFLMKRQQITALTLVQLRFLIAGGVMLAVTAGCGKSIFKGFTGKTWRVLFFHGLLAATMSVLLFWAQQLGAPVANAAMCESETPLLIFVLSLLFLRDKPNFFQFLGLLCGFTGCSMVVKVITAGGLQITSYVFTDLMVTLSALSWAIYTILARKQVRNIGGLLYTAWTMFFAGLLVLLLQLLLPGEIRYPVLPPDVCGTLLVAFIPTALAFFAWNYAQKYIPLGLLSISGYFTPALSALLAALLFDQTLTWCQCCGMVLVLGSALVEPEISGAIRHFFRKKCSAAGGNA